MCQRAPRDKKKEVRKMADFAPKSAVKSAVRKFAAPLEDVDAFNTLVQSVITNNPFGCVSYMSSGANHPPVEKSRENYTAKFVYQDSDAKKIGCGSESYSTVAGYKAGIAAVLANTANVTAHGGTPAHDSDGDTFSATLKCHAANAEIFLLTFARQQVSLSSYEDDSIQTVVETWADGVSALA
jgi:predicted RNA methylase